MKRIDVIFVQLLYAFWELRGNKHELNEQIKRAHIRLFFLLFKARFIFFLFRVLTMLKYVERTGCVFEGGKAKLWLAQIGEKVNKLSTIIFFSLFLPAFISRKKIFHETANIKST